jgi:hypothetical protein
MSVINHIFAQQGIDISSITSFNATLLKLEAEQLANRGVLEDFYRNSPIGLPGISLSDESNLESVNMISFATDMDISTLDEPHAPYEVNIKVGVDDVLTLYVRDETDIRGFIHSDNICVKTPVAGGIFTVKNNTTSPNADIIQDAALTGNQLLIVDKETGEDIAMIDFSNPALFDADGSFVFDAGLLTAYTRADASVSPSETNREFLDETIDYYQRNVVVIIGHKGELTTTRKDEAQAILAEIQALMPPGKMAHITYVNVDDLTDTGDAAPDYVIKRTNEVLERRTETGEPDVIQAVIDAHNEKVDLSNDLTEQASTLQFNRTLGEIIEEYAAIDDTDGWTGLSLEDARRAAISSGYRTFRMLEAMLSDATNSDVTLEVTADSRLIASNQVARVKGHTIYVNAKASLLDLVMYLPHEVAHLFATEVNARENDILIIMKFKEIARSIRQIDTSEAPVTLRSGVDRDLKELADLIDLAAVDYELDMLVARAQHIFRDDPANLSKLEDYGLGYMANAPPAYLEAIRDALDLNIIPPGTSTPIPALVNNRIDDPDSIDIGLTGSVSRLINNVDASSNHVGDLQSIADRIEIESTPEELLRDEINEKAWILVSRPREHDDTPFDVYRCGNKMIHVPLDGYADASGESASLAMKHFGARLVPTTELDGITFATPDGTRHENKVVYVQDIPGTPLLNISGMEEGYRFVDGGELIDLSYNDLPQAKAIIYDFLDMIEDLWKAGINVADDPVAFLLNCVSDTTSGKLRYFDLGNFATERPDSLGVALTEILDAAVGDSNSDLTALLYAANPLLKNYFDTEVRRRLTNDIEGLWPETPIENPVRNAGVGERDEIIRGLIFKEFNSRFKFRVLRRILGTTRELFKQNLRNASYVLPAWIDANADLKTAILTELANPNNKVPEWLATTNPDNLGVITTLMASYENYYYTIVLPARSNHQDQAQIILNKLATDYAEYKTLVITLERAGIKINRKKLLKALDVGCSTLPYSAGLIEALKTLTDKDIKLEGIDINEELVQEGQKWNVEPFDFGDDVDVSLIGHAIDGDVKNYLQDKKGEYSLILAQKPSSWISNKDYLNNIYDALQYDGAAILTLNGEDASAIDELVNSIEASHFGLTFVEQQDRLDDKFTFGELPFGTASAGLMAVVETRVVIVLRKNNPQEVEAIKGRLDSITHLYGEAAREKIEEALNKGEIDLITLGNMIRAAAYNEPYPVLPVSVWSELVSDPAIPLDFMPFGSNAMAAIENYESWYVQNQDATYPEKEAELVQSCQALPEEPQWLKGVVFYRTILQEQSPVLQQAAKLLLSLQYAFDFSLVLQILEEGSGLKTFLGDLIVKEKYNYDRLTPSDRTAILSIIAEENALNSEEWSLFNRMLSISGYEVSTDLATVLMEYVDDEGIGNGILYAIYLTDPDAVVDSLVDKLSSYDLTEMEKAFRALLAIQDYHQTDTATTQRITKAIESTSQADFDALALGLGRRNRRFTSEKAKKTAERNALSETKQKYLTEAIEEEEILNLTSYADIESNMQRLRDVGSGPLQSVFADGKVTFSHGFGAGVLKTQDTIFINTVLLDYPTGADPPQYIIDIFEAYARHLSRHTHQYNTEIERYREEIECVKEELLYYINLVLTDPARIGRLSTYLNRFLGDRGFDSSKVIIDELLSLAADFAHENTFYDQGTITQAGDERVAKFVSDYYYDFKGFYKEHYLESAVQAAVQGIEPTEIERISKELVTFHNKAKEFIKDKELEEGYIYTIRDLKEAATFINRFRGSLGLAESIVIGLNIQYISRLKEEDKPKLLQALKQIDTAPFNSGTAINIEEVISLGVARTTAELMLNTLDNEKLAVPFKILTQNAPTDIKSSLYSIEEMLRSNNPEQIKAVLPLLKVLPEEAVDIFINLGLQFCSDKPDLKRAIISLATAFTTDQDKLEIINKYLGYVRSIDGNDKRPDIEAIGEIAATIQDDAIKENIIVTRLMPEIYDTLLACIPDALHAISQIASTIQDDVRKKNMIISQLVPVRERSSLEYLAKAIGEIAATLSLDADKLDIINGTNGFEGGLMNMQPHYMGADSITPQERARIEAIGQIAATLTSDNDKLNIINDKLKVILEDTNKHITHRTACALAIGQIVATLTTDSDKLDIINNTLMTNLKYITSFKDTAVHDACTLAIGQIGATLTSDTEKLNIINETLKDIVTAKERFETIGQIAATLSSDTEKLKIINKILKVKLADDLEHHEVRSACAFAIGQIAATLTSDTEKLDVINTILKGYLPLDKPSAYSLDITKNSIEAIGQIAATFTSDVDKLDIINNILKVVLDKWCSHFGEACIKAINSIAVTLASENDKLDIVNTTLKHFLGNVHPDFGNAATTAVAEIIISILPSHKAELDPVVLANLATFLGILSAETPPQGPFATSIVETGTHVTIGNFTIEKNTDPSPYIPNRADSQLVNTRTTVEDLEFLASSVLMDKPTLMIGPTASRKSSLIQYLASLTNSPYRRFNLNV